MAKPLLLPLLLLLVLNGAPALAVSGSLELLYAVDVDGAVAERVALLAADLQDAGDRKGRGIDVDLQAPHRIVASARSARQLRSFARWIARHHKGELVVKATRQPGDTKLQIGLSKGHEAALRQKLWRQAVKTARARLRAYFGKKATVALQPLANNRLRIRLPAVGAGELRRFKQRFTAQMTLALHLVDDRSPLTRTIGKALEPNATVTLEQDQYNGVRGTTVRYVYLASHDRAALITRLRGLEGRLAPPVNRRFHVGPSRLASKGKPRHASYYLHRRPVLTGAHVRSATLQWNKRTGRPEVGLVFNARGAKRFEAATARHMGQRMAIVFNGRVVSAPVIQSAITGGRALITLGGFKSPVVLQREAADLVATLRAGALPAQLTLLKTSSR